MSLNEAPKAFIGTKPISIYYRVVTKLLLDNKIAVMEARGHNIPRAILVAHRVLEDIPNAGLKIKTRVEYFVGRKVPVAVLILELP